MNRLWFLLGVVALSAVVVAVNAPTWDYGFVYDDHAVVLERTPAWRQGWTDFFTSRQWGTGRHALALSMDLNLSDPPTAKPLHVVNTALAALVTALVFATGLVVGLSPLAAWVGALLFSVHPVHVDAVVSLVGRAELLAAIGVLACFVLHARGYPWPLLSLPAAAALFLVGLGSKENALALPVILLCYDLIFGAGARDRARTTVAYLLYALAAAGWFALVYPHLGELGEIAFVDNPIAALPPAERAVRAAAVLWQYVGITVLPVALKADRSFATTNPSLAAGFAASAAWLAVAALGLFARRRHPRLVFLAAWFVAAFAVTANVIVPIGTIMAERLVYLPSVGLVLLAALGIERLWGMHRFVRVVTSVAVVSSAALLAFAYDARGRLWINDAQYHMVTPLDSPNSAKAHYDRGLWLARQQDYHGAEAAFRRSLQIYPAFSRAAYYLASTLLLEDRPEDAADVYTVYLQTDPDDIGVLSQLTTVQLGLDRFSDARATAQRLITLEPDNQDHRALLQLVDDLARKNASAQSLKANSRSGSR